MKIPFLFLKRSNASYEDTIFEAIRRVVASGWYVLGEEVQKFENSFAAYSGAPHCVGVANGLDAITLLLRAYNFRPGSEVIVPANTYIATILGVLNAGLQPVLVEPRLATYLLDETLLEQHITDKTVAIFSVELYGKSPNLAELRNIATRYGLKLFSDNAQSHGALYQGRSTMAWLDGATSSFYPSKNLGALGDGGAILTHDGAIADRLRALRNYGSSKKYQFDYQGINSRLDELQAAVLSAKLPHLSAELARRRAIAARYLAEVTNPAINMPPADTIEQDAWHLFVVRVANREHFRQYLSEKGIGTDVHYPLPPHHQAALQDFAHFSFPITEKIHREVVSLPLHAQLTDLEVSWVIEALKTY